MKSERETTDWAWLAVTAIASGLAWYAWMSNIEYVRARGAVAGFALLQTLIIGALVFAVRKHRTLARCIMLFAVGQCVSSAVDWTWTLLLDFERGAIGLAQVQAAPASPKSILIAFGAWILLGGVQSLAVDTGWRLTGRLRVEGTATRGGQ